MEEWKEYKVGDIFNIQNGYAFKSGEFVDYSEDTYEVLKIGHIEVGGGLRSDPKRTFVKRESKYLKWVLEKNDIVMGMTDMKSNVVILGIPALIDKSDKYVLNQRVARLSLKDSQSFDIYFCYYQMQWKEYISELRKTANSGVQVNLTTSGISNSLLFVPDFEIQKKIGGILRTLDDKIKNNRRVNDNLEQQAQALFKSWFVDFEPFKNGEFVESELGMIPKGWRVESLTSFGRIVCGKTPSKSESSYYGGNIPFIKIPDMHNMVFVGLSEDSLSQMGDESQLAKRIPPYSILVSCIATVGLVCINTKESHTNQQINSIIPYSSFFRYYLYQKMLSLKDYLINLGRGGTATLNVNTKIFGSIKIIKPTDELLFDYDKQVSPLFNKIEANQQESRRLAELRDTLLPKLMSGELKVNEIVA